MAANTIDNTFHRLRTGKARDRGASPCALVSYVRNVNILGTLMAAEEFCAYVNAFFRDSFSDRFTRPADDCRQEATENMVHGNAVRLLESPIDEGCTISTATTTSIETSERQASSVVWILRRSATQVMISFLRRASMIHQKFALFVARPHVDMQQVLCRETARHCSPKFP